MKLTVLGLCGQSVFLEVEHFHVPGETIHAKSLHSEPGGKGFNQAVAASRLGAEVSFFTCVGQDGEGTACLEFLKKEGVYPIAQVDASSRTAYACVLTDCVGENRVTVYQGASSKMTPEFIREKREVFAQSDLLLLNNEYPMDCNVAVLELAEQYGIPAILNPAPAQKIDMELLRKFFLITPNYSEAISLLGEPANCVRHLPALFRAKGICRAVVTLGRGGALLIDGEQTISFPALPSRARDTTGAGDAFNAALAVSLMSGSSLEKAVEYAINVAALSVKEPYVMPGLPTKQQVKLNFKPVHPREMEEL